MHDLPLRCMTRDVGQSIGESVGVVEMIDVNKDGVGWGKYLRVKVLVDLTKPLAKGRVLNLPEKKLWISFQYERLPCFCFRCGAIKHGEEGCPAKGERLQHGVGPFAQFGTWLRDGVMKPLGSMRGPATMRDTLVGER